MGENFSTRPAGGLWVVRAGGAVIAESRNAMEVVEGDLPGVIYFPRADVAMAFLDKTDYVTRSPRIGDATHYSVEAKSGTIENAAFSYEAPKEAAGKIKDHIAFYTDRVTVEAL